MPKFCGALQINYFQAIFESRDVLSGIKVLRTPLRPGVTLCNSLPIVAFYGSVATSKQSTCGDIIEII